jgi:CBS domain-containing protein
MYVRDLMREDVITVREDLPVTELCDILQQGNVHGVPVVDAHGRLIGFISQEDILFGGLGGPPLSVIEGRGGEAGGNVSRVRDIMTSPAISVGPEVDVRDLGRMLWRLRIHHVPVEEGGKVLGIISSMDYCRLIGEGFFLETECPPDAPSPS